MVIYNQNGEITIPILNPHLLMNREMFQENGKTKSKPAKFDRTSSPIQMTEQDMIDVLSNAGYIIKKRGVWECI